MQTLNDRWKRHCALAKAGHTSRLATAIREYGPATFEGLALLHVRTQTEADEWEQLLIRSRPATALYNDQTGGRRNPHFSAEAESKRRASLREVKRPDASARMSEAWAKRSTEERSAIAQRMVETRRANARARKVAE